MKSVCAGALCAGALFGLMFVASAVPVSAAQGYYQALVGDGTVHVHNTISSWGDCNPFSLTVSDFTALGGKSTLVNSLPLMLGGGLDCVLHRDD